jgi:hypothetical protein
MVLQTSHFFHDKVIDKMLRNGGPGLYCGGFVSYKGRTLLSISRIGRTNFIHRHSVPRRTPMIECLEHHQLRIWRIVEYMAWNLAFLESSSQNSQHKHW